LEFRLFGPNRADVVFRGVSIEPMEADGALATVRYSWTLPPEQFGTVIGRRGPDGSIQGADDGREGFLCFGPYRKLPAGNYGVRFLLRGGAAIPVRGEVVSAPGGGVLATETVPVRDLRELHFTVASEASFEFRIWSKNRADLKFEGVQLVALNQ
jgi:hypothetical protein